MTAATLVDDAARGPLLVFGSLPPAGRDLDVATRWEADAARFRDELVARGFAGRGRELARFAECTAYGVEVTSVEQWGLDPAEADALFVEARPIDGFARLVRPAPHHVLLVLARRFARGMQLEGGRRQRLDDALREDPHAWDEAERRAPQWGLAAALAGLRAAAAGHPPTRPRRLRVRRRGVVVAISGLDGAGKSTQAEALRDALVALGVDAAVEWTKIARHASLSAVSGAVKRVLRVFVRRAPETRDVAPGTSLQLAPTSDPVKALRQRSEVLTFGWTTYLAVANARWHRRATGSASRVVICDRYVVDSLAHLRYRYGAHRRYPVQAALLRLLSPRPLRAYFLDVDPATALARKPEQYDLAQLQTLAEQYRWAQARLGVERLDGELPVEELCAAVARDVWTALNA